MDWPPVSAPGAPGQAAQISLAAATCTDRAPAQPQPQLEPQPQPQPHQQAKVEERQVQTAKSSADLPADAPAPHAWVPPTLRPVRDVALSGAGETSHTTVGELSGLRTSTEWPACAAAWCPQPQTSLMDQPADLVLAVGTYRLEESNLSSPSLDTEPEAAAPAATRAESISGLGSLGGGTAAGGLRDANPEQRERQRRQQQRDGTIRLYQFRVDPPSTLSDKTTAAQSGDTEPVEEQTKEVRQWLPVPALGEESITRLAAGALDIKWCPWLLRRSEQGASHTAEFGSNAAVKAGSAIPVGVEARAAATALQTHPLLGIACADGSVRLLKLHEHGKDKADEKQGLSALRTQRACETTAAAVGCESSARPCSTPADIAARQMSMRLEECGVGCVFHVLADPRQFPDQISG